MQENWGFFHFREASKKIMPKFLGGRAINGFFEKSMPGFLSTFAPFSPYWRGIYPKELTRRLGVSEWISKFVEIKKTI